MAQTGVVPFASTVEQFLALSAQLMQAAAIYAASEVPDAATEGEIRKLRVATAGLNGALMSIQMMPPRSMPPPAPASVPIDPPPQAPRT